MCQWLYIIFILFLFIIVYIVNVIICFFIYFVRMMFGVSSIVPNTNIDGNDLHDCVK